ERIYILFNESTTTISASKTDPGCFTPTITTSETTLSRFGYCAGAAASTSTSDSFTISGENLVGTGDITVTGSTNFEVSIDNSTFSGSVTYAYASGVITSQPKTVYVRLKSSASAGSYNENITVSGGDATAKTVACSGSVDAAPVGGTVTGGSTICENESTGTLSLGGGYSGTISDWQKSIDGGAWSSISSTSGQTSFSETLTDDGKYSYRAVITSGVCADAYSSSTTVTVQAAPTPGSISGGGTVCEGETSGTLTLSGHSDNVVEWQKSTDGGSTWTTIPSTAGLTSYESGALSVNTDFQVELSNTTCTSHSASVSVVVDAQPVGGSVAVTGANPICDGEQTSLTLSGYSGTISKWQKSTDGGTSWTDITNNTATHTTNSLSNTTIYRAIISNGVCADVVSSEATVTVNALPTPGSVSGGSTICSGETSGVLELTGNSDGVQKWQKSTDGATWIDITHTNEQYTSGALTENTEFRAVVENSNGCTDNSTATLVEVNNSPTITVQPSTTAQSECAGFSATALSVTATGANLNYQWYKNSSESNSGGTAISGATSASYTPSTATVGTEYYYCIVAGSCSPSDTSNVSGAITTYEQPVAEATANTPLYENAILELSGGPSGMATYSWTGPDGFTSDERNPTQLSISSSDDAGDYTLTVTSLYGCSDDATVNVSISAATNFYYNGSGSIADLSSWGDNNDGTGTSPANFTDDGQTFHILNTTTAQLDAAWTVSGSGTKVVIGDGTNATNFTIPESFALTTDGTVDVDVKNNATLTITNASSPTMGYLASGSTVVYNGSGAQTVKEAGYYDLTLDNTRSNATITLESGVISVSNVFDVSGLANYTVSATGNTFIFDGTGDQNIPAFEFSNLHTEMGGTKTLTGNIIVQDSLRIGAITELNAASYTMELSGSGNILTFIGKFNPGTSTVTYTSASNATVGAMNYYNLDISGGDRTLQGSNVIGIAHDFTPGGGSVTNDGSTISFNGSTAQTIPAFDFFNLRIDNTAGATMAGDATVAGQLVLRNGVLHTDGCSLAVVNTNHNAVSDGSRTSFVDGALSRHLEAELSAAYGLYKFPLGAGTEYYGFSINTVTTGEVAPVVTVDVTEGDPGGSRVAPLTSKSNTEYWDVSYTGDLTEAKVSLTDSAGIGSYNAIGHASSSNGTYSCIYGSISGNSIINSEQTTFSSFLLATRSTTAVTYTYNCSGDVHNPANWSLTAGSGDDPPADFSVYDAVWIIDCDTTITDNMTISGFNSTLQINDNDGATVTIAENVSVDLNGKLDLRGSLVTNENSSLTIDGETSLASTSSIDNSGTLTLSKDFLIEKATVVNQSLGTINVENADFTFHAEGSYDGDETQFVNHGYLEVTNGDFSVLNDFTDLSGTRDYVEFINKSGGYILVDNTLAPQKEVTFQRTLLEPEAVFFEPNSTFHVKGSDIDLEIYGGDANNTLNGDFIGEDANLDIVPANGSGGADLTVELVEGGLYLSDSDNSGDDGIITFSDSGGDMGFNVAGTMYAEGLIAHAKSGSNEIHVNDGGTMFIGNIGATLMDMYTFNLTVDNGGLLNYCGNKTSGGDDVGYVEAGGTLNYAESYYTTETPDNQSDFDVDGTQVALFETADECLAAFYQGIDGATNQFLPITLTMLYAECGDGGIVIHWQTASEENNSHFTLYRSYDGVNFEEVAVVLGAGISNEIIDYEYTDYLDYRGLVYYKLAQTDFDGTTVQSKIIMVHTCNEDTQNAFRIGQDEIIVDFRYPYEVNYVVITAVDGTIVYTKQYAGKNQAVIPNRFATGVYVITNYTQSFITSQKFIKQ
ncbi:MAG: hypothetical protein R6U95_02925, partial [Bacteroidales bacterium]